MMAKNHEQSLRELQEVGFAVHELVLYLDTHPDCRKALSLYQKYRKKYAELLAQYEAMHGPMTAGGVNSNDRWTWTGSAWPWQNNWEGDEHHVDV